MPPGMRPSVPGARGTWRIGAVRGAIVFRKERCGNVPGSTSVPGHVAGEGRTGGRQRCSRRGTVGMCGTGEAGHAAGHAAQRAWERTCGVGWVSGSDKGVMDDHVSRASGHEARVPGARGRATRATAVVKDGHGGKAPTRGGWEVWGQELVAVGRLVARHGLGRAGWVNGSESGQRCQTCCSVKAADCDAGGSGTGVEMPVHSEGTLARCCLRGQGRQGSVLLGVRKALLVEQGAALALTHVCATVTAPCGYAANACLQSKCSAGYAWLGLAWGPHHGHSHRRLGTTCSTRSPAACSWL